MAVVVFLVQVKHMYKNGHRGLVPGPDTNFQPTWIEWKSFNVVLNIKTARVARTSSDRGILT